MDKLHVLVIPTWYPNGADKLMGQYHKDFCNALSLDGRMKANMLFVYRQGLSLAGKYITMKKDFVDNYENIKIYGRKMLDVCRINPDIQMKLYTKALFKAYKIYEKEHGKPDVIHAQVAVPAGYACCKLGEKIGVPVIMTEHATYFERFFHSWEEKYNDYVMKNSLITCVGDFMLDTYKEKGVKAYILPNIVDCKKFDIPHNEATNARFNVVSVGAMRKVKRYDNTMDAIKNLKDEIPYIHYTIVGDGESEEYFKEHCEKIGMKDYVTFVGRKNHSEIAEIFKDIDTLVVASDIETFGIPAVEALAAGLPVVSTKNFGTEMFLNSETGYLCKVNDVKDLTDAIREMYITKDIFKTERLKEIANSFDGAKVADMAYNYYKQIIK